MRFTTLEVKDGLLGPEFEDAAIDSSGDKMMEGWYFLGEDDEDATGPYDTERQAEEYGHFYAITEELATRAAAIHGDTAEKHALVRIVDALRSDFFAPTGP